MVREIVFDTETTGLNPEHGDRLVEIGAIELINHIPTGKTYHQYINPQRSVPEEVVKVHGLTEEFLKDFPVFDDIADDFVDFVGEDGILVAHNASFDMKFINYELQKSGREEFSKDRVIDSLEIARKMFPGAKNNLDALCKRYGVDNSSRTFHGALLDADLLAQVYFELMGGAEPSMLNNSNDNSNKASNTFSDFEVERIFRKAREFTLSEEEEQAHREFLKKNIKNAIWLSDELASSDK
ncbi:MAG: DNA polymerase III subunit epsilon [Alphaproteobacteria bacterium]|nr:DNA polymerase III subunit epsilon [Alphaproteobacteria bacterium]